MHFAKYGGNMKRLLAAVLATLMLVSMLAAVVFAGDFSLEIGFLEDETFVLGDVNCDGAMNAMDSYYLKVKIV